MSANKIELTSKQAKVFADFKKAYKSCKKAGIEFYTVLETVSAYNGKHVKYIEIDLDLSMAERRDLHSSGVPAGDVNLPYIIDCGFSGYADDAHVFVMKER